MTPSRAPFFFTVCNANSLRFFLVNLTANDYCSYPTLYFVPANAKKSPKKYEGAREVKDMLDFVKKNKTFKKTKQEL